MENSRKDTEVMIDAPKWRVLVVDNDPVVATDHAYNLKLWGYEYYVASGLGDALRQDALRLARTHRCHLALVDMRLEDDYDIKDVSGLGLVKDLYPLPAIVVSGYGSYKIAGEAIRNAGARDFVGKESGPKALLEAIETFFRETCGADSHFRGKINWPRIHPARIADLLFERDTPVQAREIECLVRRLFAEPPLSTAGALRLNTIQGEPLSIGSRSLQHSVVLRAGADAFEPAVIKLAPAAQVEDEYQNYMRYIYQQLPASRHSELQKYELIGFIGGIRYRFLGTSVVSLKTLADSFKDLDAEAINSCLSLFFGDTWLAKYKQARMTGDKSLFAAYAECWGPKWIERMQEFSLNTELLQFDIGGRRLRLPNPVPWLLKQVDVANGGQQDATGGYIHYCAVTHGDLHCGNLFIDKHREPWIIDYERTGEGPILRDFVELELDIILQGLSTTEAEPEIPPVDVHRLFVTLLAANELDTPAPVDLGDQRLDKILHIARHIRKLASQIADPGQNVEVHQYYWGLLFDITLAMTYRMHKMLNPDDNALSHAHTFEPNVTDVSAVKQFDAGLWTMLLLGGMICYRLERKRRDWPPAFEIQQRSSGKIASIGARTGPQPVYEGPPAEAYTDFHLHIDVNGSILARSDEGERRGKMPLSISPEVQLPLDLIRNNRTSDKLIKGLGEQLYELLFPTAIDKHFNQTEAVARGRNQSVRIRLTVDPDNLAGIPWEFTYRSEEGYFLSTNPHTVFSRYLELARPARTRTNSTEPLDLLLIIAAPNDQGALDADEWEAIATEALAEPIQDERIRIRVVKKATRREISDALLKKNPNIVQYVGHATYQNGRGCLALVDSQTGGTWAVDDERFAGLFMGSDSQLGLVSLAACESATSESPKGFLGIAPQLVQRGTPAVIAMQYSVLASTSKVFLDQFYRAVAARKPLDWALQSARNAIFQERGLDSREFATPVLYMRARDGQVF
jgi:ActR/RegA family two-component response regulator